MKYVRAWSTKRHALTTCLTVCTHVYAAIMRAQLPIDMGRGHLPPLEAGKLRSSCLGLLPDSYLDGLGVFASKFWAFLYIGVQMLQSFHLQKGFAP